MANYQDTYSALNPPQQGNKLSQYAMGGSGIQPSQGLPQPVTNPFNAFPQQQDNQQGMNPQFPGYGQQGIPPQSGMMQPNQQGQQNPYTTWMMNPNQSVSPYIQQQQQMQADPNARQNQLIRYGMGGV